MPTCREVPPPLMRARRARSGPEGPARGPEGPARASVARPLYLKLLTRHTIKPGTRQAKKQHIKQSKSHIYIYHSIICTENALVQGLPHPSGANIRGGVICVTTDVGMLLWCLQLSITASQTVCRQHSICHRLR